MSYGWLTRCKSAPTTLPTPPTLKLRSLSAMAGMAVRHEVAFVVELVNREGVELLGHRSAVVDL